MEMNDFSGDAVVQTSPTGRYGVVFYSFNWSGFARSGDGLTIGDVFAGGMYLAKDNTLIIRVPSSYTVKTVEPEPDQVRDGLIWYGLRSFGAGEPRIVLEKPAFPVFPVALGLVIIVMAGFIVFTIIKRRRQPDEQKEPAASLSETERGNIEERIIRMLQANNGELFQSEIVKNLGVSKTTVSITLNDLHHRGVIQKVKKGKENLIRLT
jgi:predicted transcriptional regulator